MKTPNESGFTLIEIMIVVAIIGMLAAIAIPNFKRAIDDARRRTCTANLQNIQGAKVRWALDQKKPDTETPPETELFGTRAYIEKKPECPAGGTYQINAVEAKSTCTIEGHAL